MFRRPSSAPSDADSFSAEALQFLQPLFATAMRLTRNRADAEDLVQDTYVKAFGHSGQYKRGTNLRAWLYTILHNTWRNQRRDASRDTVEIDSEQVEQAAEGGGGGEPVETPERILMRSTLDADLQAALDELPDAFREAVWLRDVEEFTYAEIAEMVNVPIGTVMSRISRGRRMLFEKLTAPVAADRGVQAAGGRR
jgi:RNA polymerase sigma-70 factor, ECF subfamily